MVKPVLDQQNPTRWWIWPDRFRGLMYQLYFCKVNPFHPLPLPQQALQHARVAIRGTAAGPAVTNAGRASLSSLPIDRDPVTYRL